MNIPEILPCPFCGEKPIKAHGMTYSVHVTGPCILSGKCIHDGAIELWNRRPTPQPTREAATASEKRVKELEAVTWRKCSERMPEPLTPVLVACIFLLDGETCVYLLYRKPGEDFWRFDDTQDDKLSDDWQPTHWMPLPSPPEDK